MELENDALGEWYVDPKIVDLVIDNKKPEEPFQMPYVSYSKLVRRFMKDVYQFEKTIQNMSETVTVIL